MLRLFLETEWLCFLGIEFRKRKDKESQVCGFGSVGLVPGVVLFHSLKTLKQKTWEMFSDQLHILGVEVFPFHVSQTSYTTHLISIWMTSITSRWEINYVCQNIFTFLQENVPIKLRIIKNLNLYFVIWLGHAKGPTLWNAFEIWTRPICTSGDAYFSFQLPFFSFSLPLPLSLSSPPENVSVPFNHC